jgi:hypothetical protein
MGIKKRASQLEEGVEGQDMWNKIHAKCVGANSGLVRRTDCKKVWGHVCQDNVEVFPRDGKKENGQRSAAGAILYRGQTK